MNPPLPRLLLIDDDDSYRLILARALARRDFSVETAANPEQGLALARSFDPEYILLDLNLAGQSGLNLIQPLLESCPGARIVILTGYASIQTTVSAMRLGACHYLPKPANVEEIIKALLTDTEEVLPPTNDQALTVQLLEWEYIQRKLAEHQGNISATARALHMHRRTLQRKLSKRRPQDGDHDLL